MQDIIVGIGEILWDVFPTGKVLGGAPANFAYHVSQLGLNGCAISAIGKDDLGNEIIESLQEKGLKTHIEKVSFPTGTVEVTLSGEGIPEYVICENVAWDNIPYTEELDKIAKQTKVVCFGSLAQRNSVSHNTIKQFLNNVPKDALKVFDINLRQNFYHKELIEASLQECNILKLNEDEIVVIADMLGWKDLSDSAVAIQLLEFYKLNIVVLTKGSEGSYLFTSQESSFLPTPKVEVVDTVGAGDSFTAGLVASLLKGDNIKEAHKKAVNLSAYVCTQKGAMPKLTVEI